MGIENELIAWIKSNQKKTRIRESANIMSRVSYVLIREVYFMYLKTREQRTIFDVCPNEIGIYRNKIEQLEFIIPDKIEKLELVGAEWDEYDQLESILEKISIACGSDLIIDYIDQMEYERILKGETGISD